MELLDREKGVPNKVREREAVWNVFQLSSRFNLLSS
jgi:hypothetical protein